MGMTYIIGVNPKSDEQSAHLNLNSTSEMYLDSVFTLAIKSKLPDLYEKISEEVIFIRFDYLSQKDFMTVVNQIRQLKDRTDLLEGNATLVASR